ncbi:hypothetical protein ACKAV7_014652 [Fusarium commune]
MLPPYNNYRLDDYLGPDPIFRRHSPFLIYTFMAAWKNRHRALGKSARAAADIKTEMESSILYTHRSFPSGPVRTGEALTPAVESALG